MGRWVLMVGLASACGRYNFAPIDTPPGDQPYRKEVKLNTSTPLSNAMISIAVTDSDVAVRALPDGTDLAFTDQNGALIPYELVDYGSGRIEAWILVPVVTSPATTIWMTYGGTSVPRTSPWTGYRGVWHLGANSTLETDSSASLNHLTSIAGAVTPAPVPGIVGGARDFDGADDLMGVTDPANGSLDFGTDSFTYSTWVYITTNLSTYDHAIHKGGVNAVTPGYDIELGTSDWNALVGDGVSFVTTRFGDQSQFVTAWTSLVAVVDRSTQTFRAYANGVQADTDVLAGIGSLDSMIDFTLSRDSSSMPVKGTLDEVRVVEGAMSAERIATEYASIADPTFTTIGPEQMAP